MIRKADITDIPAIRTMADVVFRQTYKDILSPAQMEYMMDMMYSEESLRRQMLEEGNRFYIAEGDAPGGADRQDDNASGLAAGRSDGSACMLQGYASFRPDGSPCMLQGYASFRPDGRTDDGRPRFHLEKLYVLPACQKTGLGLELFRRIGRDAAALAAGPFRLELNVNRGNPALGFYEHLGMRRDRQGDFPIGHGYYMNDYIMALDLPRPVSI